MSRQAILSLRGVVRAGAFVAALVVAGAAQAAYTTGAVNLRAGPGTRYQVIATAPPGAYVDLRSCAGSWCKVRFRGISGWMSSIYIARGAPRYAPPRYAPPRYAPPPPPRYYYYPRPYYPKAYPRYYRPGPSYGIWFGFRG